MIRHLLLTTLIAVLPLAALAQQAPQRSIVNLTGQLYRAQNNNHYTVYLVTPEGVIMSDPINRDFGRWLKAEIATRHKVPVRYVLYTHHDWDHASGGVVFADTAAVRGAPEHAGRGGAASGQPATAGRRSQARRQQQRAGGPRRGDRRHRRPVRRHRRQPRRRAERRRAGPRSAERRLPAVDHLHRPPHGDARRQARRDALPGHRAHARRRGALLPRRAHGVQRRRDADQAPARGAWRRPSARGSTRCARSPRSTSRLPPPATRSPAPSRTRSSRCAISRTSARAWPPGWPPARAWPRSRRR